VYARFQPDGVSDALEKPAQLRRFLSVETRAKLRIEGRNDLRNLGDQGMSCWRYVDLERASVLDPANSNDTTSVFEIVDQPDHVVAMHAEGVRQLLLRLDAMVNQVAEHRVGAGRQVQSSETVREQLRGSGAGLRHQEGNRARMGR
jgi:hypothetical protein